MTDTTPIASAGYGAVRAEIRRLINWNPIWHAEYTPPVAADAVDSLAAQIEAGAHTIGELQTAVDCITTGCASRYDYELVDAAIIYAYL